MIQRCTATAHHVSPKVKQSVPKQLPGIGAFEFDAFVPCRLERRDSFLDRANNRGHGGDETVVRKVPEFELSGEIHRGVGEGEAVGCLIERRTISARELRRLLSTHGPTARSEARKQPSRRAPSLRSSWPWGL